MYYEDHEELEEEWNNFEATLGLSRKMMHATLILTDDSGRVLFYYRHPQVVEIGQEITFPIRIEMT
jgi:hypothetical protein